MVQPQDILDFWFEADPKLWFSKNDAFDDAIRSRFSQAMLDARSGELASWKADVQGVRALIILLDQFSRNLFRGSAEAYACDPVALLLSYDLIERAEWASLSPQEQLFGVLPMMHSEAIEDQKKCLALIKPMGIEGATKSALEHLDIIQRFGRFPHRNIVLGRTSTLQEEAFLAAGGFAG